MTDQSSASDELRDETAADAPEVAEHDAHAKLVEEIERLKAELLYAQAEMQNVRRRLERDKADATAYAVTGFARDMLSVADNLARALDAIPVEVREDDRLRGVLTGIDMTGKELGNVFQRHGISRIDAVGETLDPNRHQAMVEMPSDQPAGTIVQEMQAGYMIRDRLLRPALVGVAKAE